ncbi:MAG: hypothetical protein JXB88_18030 [Spirochaetales bacterium]|nr:hypothetical protein [Spirochaetales bacterium]
MYDDLNNLVCFIKEKDIQNRNKGKKELTVYRDESESAPILHLFSKKIRDLPPVISILDAGKTTRIGSLKQNGYKWLIMDNEDKEIAWLKRRTALEMIKDYESGYFPKKYIIEMKNSKKVVAEINKQFPFFLKKHYVDFSKDNGQLLDRRLGLSAFVMHILSRNHSGNHNKKKE